MGKIVDFYLGKCGNQANETLDQILSYSDRQLEKGHTHIQWLFPLDEPSLAVASSPIISKEEIEIFRNSPGLITKVRSSLDRMMGFYGLRVEQHGRFLCARNDDFEAKIEDWLTPRNHNYKRLTRIMRCLNLFGMKEITESIQMELLKIATEYPTNVGPTTVAFWKEALTENTGE